jgi:protocatechuate 3,4-dioxygenase beta subunit
MPGTTGGSMANEARTKIYGLIGLAVLVLGLWWWLGRDGSTGSEGDTSDARASADAKADGPALAPVPLRRSDVDVWTAPRAVIAGTVRDEQARPIVGAQVCAKLQDGELAQTERRPPHCVTTREDGSYRIDQLLGAEHHLFASARGYLPARHESRSGIQGMLDGRLDLQAGTTRDGVDFILKEGGVEVTGVVKDLAGGEIEGAWVSSGGSWGADQGATFTRSDDEGRFSLWVEPPQVTISAFADGYAQGGRGAAIPGSFVEIFLTPESVVVGKVVWAGTDKPVAGAQISAGSRNFFSGGGGNGSVYSEDDGSFRLEGLEPGAYKLSAWSDELTGISAEKVHVGLGQTSEPVVVEVHPAFAVRGVVLVDGETPCSYGTIRLQDRQRKDEPSRGSTGQEDGTVLIKGILPGTYEVSVSCNTYVSEAEYPDLVIAEASLEGLEWAVHAGRSIRGTVVDAKGQPVANARVSARGKADKDPRARLSNSWAERTEPSGSFTVAGLLPGSYEVSVNHEELPSPDEPTVVEVPEGQDVADITLTLPASGEIQGIVRDEKGVAVAGVSVQLEGPRWGGAQTNDAGRFTMKGVQVGEHRIVAERGWTDTMRAPGASDDDEAGQRVQVTADEVTEVELVVESQNGRITGRVVGEGGEPIADAFVDAVRESDSAAASAGGGRGRARWGSWARQPVLTDEDGRFELTDLAEQGVYGVHANRKGGGEAIAEHVKTGSDVELAIGETGVLAGVVKLAGGGFPRRFDLSAVDRANGVSQRDGFLYGDGQWRLTNLSAGKYEVAVTASEGNAKIEVELAEGGEQTGIEIVLTPRVTLKGKLVDAATGEAVAGLKVSVRGEGGGSFRIGQGAGKADQKDISDAQGNFVVEDVPTGKVSVMVMAPGFTDNDYGWTWVARRLGTEPSTQDIGSIELVKDRVERGKEGGDLGFKTKAGEPGTEPENVRHVVAFVRPGSPAAAAGLKVGDEIITVDGQDVVGTESYRYTKLVTVLPGTKVVLGLADDRSVPVTAAPPA